MTTAAASPTDAAMSRMAMTITVTLPPSKRNVPGCGSGYARREGGIGDPGRLGAGHRGCAALCEQDVKQAYGGGLVQRLVAVAALRGLHARRAASRATARQHGISRGRQPALRI